jgi:hypothetical protein
MIASVRPRDLAGKTRRRLAAELAGELAAIDKKTRALDKELTELVTARGSTLMGLHGIGPSGAARLLADVGGIHRFASRDRFASWNGTAPLDASSGSQARHRLSRAGEPAHQPRPAHHGGSGAWNGTQHQPGGSQRCELFLHASSVPCCGTPGRPVGRGADDRGTAGLKRSFISLSAFVPKVGGHD